MPNLYLALYFVLLRVSTLALRRIHVLKLHMASLSSGGAVVHKHNISVKLYLCIKHAYMYVCTMLIRSKDVVSNI